MGDNFSISHRKDRNNQADKETLVCIDPGSAKSGLVVMRADRRVVERKIVPTDDLEKELSACIDRYNPGIILMGNGTWSKKIKPGVKKVIGELPLEMVNEKFSTERARERYFKENPPRGLWKLVPITLQVPPEAYDDYAAIVMAEDYLDQTEGKLERS